MDAVTGASPTAAVIAVGSELLELGRTDTNSPFIVARLRERGMSVAVTCVVSDERADLVATIRHAHAHVDLVVCTGGLGPTDDDRTRDAVASVLGLAMHEDPDVVEFIRERFAARGLAMPDVNRRQAQVPEGATVLPNPRGSAPGLWLSLGAKAILLLPGPPREMAPMLEHALDHQVAAVWGAVEHAHRQVLVAGRSESWVEEQVQPLYAPWREESPSVRTTVLASLGIVELHLSAHGADGPALASRLERAVEAFRARLGPDVVSVDGRGLEEAAGDLLRRRGWRVGVAESCTGGLIASRLTDVAGSSDYVDRALVVYSNASKVELLGVDPDLIAAHGAVSEPVAVAMAQGLRHGGGAEVAVAITGIAGPGGGSPAKPVGTVCIAVAGPAGTVVTTFRFGGERAVVKAMSASTAIDRLRRYLIDAPE